MRLSNNTNLPLSIAAWVATDEYDHDDDPYTISATTLIKPLRQIVLARQNQDMTKAGDVSALISSRMGTAIHNSIESTWVNRANIVKALKMLGYPDTAINRIKINPTAMDLAAEPDTIAVYLEQRTKKQVGKYKVSGKIDFVAEGNLEDFKTTGVYSYINSSNDKIHKLQGSIYRWLNPTVITGGNINIQYIFTDWSALQATMDKNYPQSRIVSKSLELMSIPETDAYVKNRIATIDRLMGAPQTQLPQCTPEELWQSAPVYKYYKNPAKKDRSTKNFDNMHDANARLIKDGNVGEVVTFPGSPKRCRYCDVVGVCEQAAHMLQTGVLTL